MSVNVEHLDRAMVLAALYNGSRPLGMGFLQYDPKPMTTEEARQLLGPEPVKDCYFDYLKGRVMKIQMGGNSIETRLYNRDNGEQAAEKIIESLQNSSDTNTTEIQQLHKTGLKDSANETKSHLNTPTIIDGSIITIGLEDFKHVLGPKIEESLKS